MRCIQHMLLVAPHLYQSVAGFHFPLGMIGSTVGTAVERVPLGGVLLVLHKLVGDNSCTRAG